MGAWGAVANKLKHLKKHVFFCLFFFFFGGGGVGGRKINQASLQIIKWYVRYILPFLERNYINICGSGAIATRSQQNFNELNKMEA